MPKYRHDLSDESDEPKDDTSLRSKELQNRSVGKKNAGRGGQKMQNQPDTPRQYCTQKCLLGIVSGFAIDQECPNAPFHPHHGMRHAINSRSEFQDLVQQQLGKDLDHDCQPLKLQGARGAMFKIRLVSHGYVFVGKGTVEAFISDLWGEGQMYIWMQRLQGTAIPVYLGNIHLINFYHLDIGVTILHMLFLSWGGQMIDKDETAKAMPNLQQEINRTIAEVEHMGIDQGDYRDPNFLWNPEAQRVMLIDFERANYRASMDKTGYVPEDEETKSISPNSSDSKKRVHTRTRNTKRKTSFDWPSATKKSTHASTRRQNPARKAKSHRTRPYFDQHPKNVSTRKVLSH